MSSTSTQGETAGNSKSAQTITSNLANKKVTVTIGSKNFTEEFILGQIYAQALKAVQELSSIGVAGRIWKRVELGAEGVRLLKEQFPAALYIKAAFDLGFLQYMY